eukprot:363481-Chlamydomonas_euryale.AAC.2
MLGYEAFASPVLWMHPMATRSSQLQSSGCTQWLRGLRNSSPLDAPNSCPPARHPVTTPINPHLHCLEQHVRWQLRRHVWQEVQEESKRHCGIRVEAGDGVVRLVRHDLSA